jgi:hypothetical protein
MTIEGPRVLDKVLPGCVITTGTGAEIDSVVGGNWRAVLGIDGIAVQRDYFDNSGYGVGDLTMFVQGVEMQYPGPISGTDTAIAVLEYVTTELITDEEIVATMDILPGGSAFNGSGFSRSTMNQEQIIYARRRLYVLNNQITPVIPNLHSTNMWGTCNASTGDKIYITRIVNMGSFDTQAFIPDVNVVLVAVIAKEKELPYLMRASRSYEASAVN